MYFRNISLLVFLVQLFGKLKQNKTSCVYYWIHSYFTVHRKDLGTVGPGKSMRW